MPSKVDARRLRDGAAAAAAPDAKDKDGLKAQLDEMCDAITALQSLDDLGSEEANQAAWDQMISLQKRYERLKTMYDVMAS